MANKFNLNLQQGYAQQLSFNGATKNYDSVKGLLMRCSLAVYCIWGGCKKWNRDKEKNKEKKIKRKTLRNKEWLTNCCLENF